MEHFQLLEELFDKKILKIIKFFLLNKGKEFYLQEISKNSNIPIATVFRLIKKLKQLSIIEEIKIKRFKLYRCGENENVTFLESFIKEGKRILDKFVSLASNLSNIEEIILYGKESEDKANVLLIGKNIDSNEVKKICAEIKDKYNFIINSLNLEKEQYEQMTAMGLYSSYKTTLFKR